MRIVGILWGILAVPAVLLALVYQMCDSPYGCMHTPDEYALYFLFTLSPLIFVAGAVAGFNAMKNMYLRYALLVLPLVPLGVLVFYYFV